MAGERRVLASTFYWLARETPRGPRRSPDRFLALQSRCKTRKFWTREPLEQYQNDAQVHDSAAGRGLDSPPRWIVAAAVAAAAPREQEETRRERHHKYPCSLNSVLSHPAEECTIELAALRH